MDIRFPITPNPHLAQQTWEFLTLQKFIRGKKLLEIGSRYGESLLRFALTMGEGSTLVSIDNDTESTLGHFYFNALFLKRHEVHMIHGDSHDSKIIEQAKNLGPYDFCFVDGDHTEEGVTKDYENFMPMTKVMAFHDILLPEVAGFWQKHRRDHPMIEILHPACDGAMGIGVLFKEYFMGVE